MTALPTPLHPAPPLPYDISIVVPVYGGEHTIAPLSEAIRTMAEREDLRVETIFVCDSPRDQSWNVARQLAEETPHTRAALLARNFGQHPATLLGIRMARGRVIVTMDEDLQHNPDDVPKLAHTAETHRCIAYGKATELKHSWWRNTTSQFSKWFLTHYIGVQNARNLSAFRAFPSSLRQAFEHYRSERVAIDVLLSWTGAPARVVPCEHAQRQDGHSGYTLRKLIAYLFDLMLGFSIAPLRLASLLGLAAVGLSFILAFFVLIRWIIVGSQVPGFAFIALSVSTFAGVQLLAVGTIGEYLGRLYFNSLGRPQYLVSELSEHPSTLE